MRRVRTARPASTTLADEAGGEVDLGDRQDQRVVHAEAAHDEVADDAGR